MLVWEVRKTFVRITLRRFEGQVRISQEVSWREDCSRQTEAPACRPWGGEELEAFEEQKGSQHSQSLMHVEMTIMG